MIVRTRMVLLAGLVFAAILSGRMHANETPALLLEIRRAQREPAEGLEKVEMPGRRGQVIFLHPKVELTNADVAEASVGHTEQGHLAIDLTLTAAGAKKFGELTASHLNRPLAFLIDGKLVCAPVVQSKLSKHAQIVGSFSADEAERIADGIVGRAAQ